jgi:hypothetical protein
LEDGTFEYLQPIKLISSVKDLKCMGDNRIVVVQA